MQLSETERLILFRRYQILAQVTPQVEEAKVFRRNQVIIHRGFEAHYDELTHHEIDRTWGQFDSSSKENSLFVLDVLDMYNDLNDKQGLTQQQIQFPGFDLNREGAFLFYAKLFSMSE